MIQFISKSIFIFIIRVIDMNIKKWKLAPFNKNRAQILAEDYSLPALLAALLSARGIDNDEKLVELLGEPCEFDDPFMLLDMDKAVDRIITAIENFERIAVYGDYDADGVTSTALLYTYLQSKEADVMYYIPSREGEGYGMNENAVEHLASLGVDLIITVDNGIASVNEVAKAKELGIDVVVTDHHRPQGVLPDAVAVVDPYREGCPSVFKHFAGVGVAFKLIYAIETDLGNPDELIYDYGDLVTLGTIGDIVPLESENRTLVRLGLEFIKQSKRPGIKALIERAGVSDREITTTLVAFSLVPRLNATGRMGNADIAVNLLTTKETDIALSLAESICNDNNDRRDVESEICDKVINIIENNENIKYSRIMVINGENWHHGVVGIVAARITEKYGKPCIIISIDKGEAKGSGRSIEGFNLFEALNACKDVLIRFGGHPMAAGITLKANKIEEFRTKINAYAKETVEFMPAAQVNIDLKLQPKALNTTIPEILKALEPYGAGNAIPVFGLYCMKVQNITPVGNGNHLRVALVRDNTVVNCMKFSTTIKEFPYRVGDTVDIACVLENKSYKSATNLTVLIKEIRETGVDDDVYLKSYRLYERTKTRETMNSAEALSIKPSREDLAEIYRFIRAMAGFNGSVYKLTNTFPGRTVGKILFSLDVMERSGLISVKAEGECLDITLLPVKGKVDIMASALFDNIKVKD